MNEYYNNYIKIKDFIDEKIDGNGTDIEILNKLLELFESNEFKENKQIILENYDSKNELVEIVFLVRVTHHNFEYNQEMRTHVESETVNYNESFIWKMSKLSWLLLNLVAENHLLYHYSTYGATSQQLDYKECDFNEMILSSFIKKNDENINTDEFGYFIINEEKYKFLDSSNKYHVEEINKHIEDVTRQENIMNTNLLLNFTTIDDKIDFYVELIEIENIFKSMKKCLIPIKESCRKNTKYIIDNYMNNYFINNNFNKTKKKLIPLLNKIIKNKHWINIKNLILSYFENEKNDIFNKNCVSVLLKNIKIHDFEYSGIVWNMNKLSWFLLNYYNKNNLLENFIFKGNEYNVKKITLNLNKTNFIDFFDEDYICEDDIESICDLIKLIVNKNKFFNEIVLQDYFEKKIFNSLDEQTEFLIRIVYL